MKTFVQYIETINPSELTDLERGVLDDILYNADNPNYAYEIMLYGCKSGIVSWLTYADDCKTFVTEHLDEVLALFEEAVNIKGMYFSSITPSSLAWLAYEETLLKFITEFELVVNE